MRGVVNECCRNGNVENGSGARDGRCRVDQERTIVEDGKVILERNRGWGHRWCLEHEKIVTEGMGEDYDME